ncbi:Putative deoxyribonuclease RhsC [Ferriphaselus amnicola]|uniref:Deoxyribonuclease RhsC n=2 Tax=Ferriphaselus amnicola TaxID=1188319 RepID=A0A2Z6GEA8_9PROT|nr:Putative deoxyribonuclease RhsC [Ferriphaselus amnicola]
MMTHSNIGRTVRGYRLFRTVLSMGVLCIGLLGFNASAMAAVTAKMTSPVANATVAEPGRFVLTATATSTGGTIKNVAFYSGTTLLNTDTTSPYTFTWNNVAAGTYVLKAKATDSKNATATSTTVTVTVTKVVKAYYIDVDHLNTPRAVTNSTGAAVWTWDNVDPYGANVPNENPGGLGAFAFNLRFPGQYFDKETSTHYNYFRDYDPAVGRYVQSDVIGLGGGVNTYTYVGGKPLSYTDPLGLCPFCIIPALPLIPEVAIIGTTWWAMKPPKDAYDPNGAKAPGQPGDGDGFCEPKKGPKWGRSPNGRGNGWVDNDGNVWVPTGLGGEAHGGPHWDVQRPGGGYDNVYPGGKTR